MEIDTGADQAQIGWHGESEGYAAAEGMHADTKPAKGPHSRPVAQQQPPDSRGTVVEELCERYKLHPVVVSQEAYRGWTGYGYTEQIFCGDYLRELEER